MFLWGILWFCFCYRVNGTNFRNSIIYVTSFLQLKETFYFLFNFNMNRLYWFSSYLNITKLTVKNSVLKFLNIMPMGIYSLYCRKEITP